MAVIMYTSPLPTNIVEKHAEYAGILIVNRMIFSNLTGRLLQIAKILQTPGKLTNRVQIPSHPKILASRQANLLLI